MSEERRMWKKKERWKGDMTELRKGSHLCYTVDLGIRFCPAHFSKQKSFCKTPPSPSSLSFSLTSSPSVKLFLLWGFSLRPLLLSPQVSPVCFCCFLSLLFPPPCSVLTLHILHTAGVMGNDNNQDKPQHWCKHPPTSPAEFMSLH